MTTNPLLSNDLDTTTKEVGDFSVPLTDKRNFQRIPPVNSIEQVRAALDAIDKLIDMIDCTDKHNLALLPLFLAQQKRADAALTRMEQP